MAFKMKATLGAGGFHENALELWCCSDALVPEIEQTPK